MMKYSGANVYWALCMRFTYIILFIPLPKIYGVSAVYSSFY